MKWRSGFFFFCLEREQERSSSLKPSSWLFLPCVTPPAAPYTLLQVTCKEQPWGGAGCGALRLQAESCALSPRPFCGLRGGLVSDLWFLSFVSGYPSHLSFQLVFLGENTEVKEMMTTWTLQKGLPLVVVKQEGRSLGLRQERFPAGLNHEDPEWRALQERWLLLFA